MINLTLNHLSYDDDEEYRAILCDVFDIPDYEADGADQFEFDAHFKDIYEATKMNPFFMEIFTKAAGFMFSQDPLTGICILCSYDYLALFYDAFVSYHASGYDPAFGKDKHVCAMALWQRIMN
jgi:hypothetical protein